LQSFQHGFSWQALVDLAVAHDVLPPLIWALNHRSLLPPVPVKLAEEARAAHVTSRLSAAYGDHLRRQADLRDQLIAALAALNAEGIVPLLLKGAVHLTLPQSEWHAARAMRDIDMLVAAKQATRANAILLALGYRADPNPPPLDRHLPELHLPNRAGTIELHTEALSFPARYALNTEEVFARAQNRSIGSANFQVVPPEWHLLHGLLHHQLADRGHARRILSIKGLWEFARVGAGVNSDGWNSIAAHAEYRKILDMLSSWAVQANRLFGLEVPATLLRHPAGRKHADATFRLACAPYRLRQFLFVADKLSFAFAPKTLALRYRDHSAGSAALSHIGFLWRRRGQMVKRWHGKRHQALVATSILRDLGLGQLGLDLAGARIGSRRRRPAIPFRGIAKAAGAEMA
jgi:hypothetical protein